MQVFLGGTAGNSKWRDHVISTLLGKVPNLQNHVLFNPVVKDWNAEAQKREDEVKANADYHIYYITDPMQEGIPISVYSVVEATLALYDRPDITAVVFDNTGMTGHSLRAMNKIAKTLKERFPSEHIFESPGELTNWLADVLNQADDTQNTKTQTA